MSGKIAGVIWDYYPDGGGELLTALCLADHAWHDGTQIFPSVRRIAELTRQSERTVQRHLDKMRRTGWLVTVDQADGSPGKTTIYRIPIEHLPQPIGVRVTKWHPSTRVHEIVHTGDIGRGVRVTSEAPTGDTAMSPETSCKRPLNVNPVGGLKPAGPVDEVFEEAWKAYPRRTGDNPKGAARQKWNARIKEGDQPNVLRAGVDRYAAYIAATDRQGTEYVMQAVRFFGRDKAYLQKWDAPTPVKPNGGQNLNTLEGITAYGKKRGIEPKLGETKEAYRARLLQDEARA